MGNASFSVFVCMCDSVHACSIICMHIYAGVLLILPLYKVDDG